MISFIAFSELRAGYCDEGLSPSASSKLAAIARNTSDCRFVASLGNIVDGAASDELSANTLENVINSFGEAPPFHPVLGELDFTIERERLQNLCKFSTRYRAWDFSDYRCIFLDTLNDGTIDDEQFGWLSRLLGRTHRPAIIFSHIPLAVSEARGDAKTVSNSAALRELIEKSKRVTLVLQGGEVADRAVYQGVPYITLTPMNMSDEPTFAKLSVSSKGIVVEGFGAQESYSIPVIEHSENKEEKKRGFLSFFKRN